MKHNECVKLNALSVVKSFSINLLLFHHQYGAGYLPHKTYFEAILRIMKLPIQQVAKSDQLVPISSSSLCDDGAPST